MCACMRACIYVYVYVHICVRACIYIYVYIYEGADFFEPVRGRGKTEVKAEFLYSYAYKNCVFTGVCLSESDGTCQLLYSFLL